MSEYKLKIENAKLINFCDLCTALSLDDNDTDILMDSIWPYGPPMNDTIYRFTIGHFREQKERPPNTERKEHLKKMVLNYLEDNVLTDKELILIKASW